jgi:ATP-binding cassette subfamily G (WHITE) protein 2 (SNQ2)
MAIMTPADTAMLYDEKQHHELDATPPPESPSRNVDVVEAEQAFNKLSRQLTIQSEVARQKSETSSATVTGRDVEKGAENANFDLREYLSSSNDANQQAGIKHKVGTARYSP